MAEFKDSVVQLSCNRDIYSFPLPEVSKDWSVSKCEVYRVEGIEKELFKELNNKVVNGLPKGYSVKRRKINKATRGFLTNDEGEFEYEDFTVPSGSLVVRSKRSLDLPYSIYTKPEDGFGYVDFTETDGEREFLYVIPKEYLFQVNQTALAISVKDMKNFSGMGFKTWTMGYVYIHVIPYKPNLSYTGTRILKTGIGLQYGEEISAIVDKWQADGVIPIIELCNLEDGTNLCTKPTVTGYSDYSPSEFVPINHQDVYGSEEVKSE